MTPGGRSASRVALAFAVLLSLGGQCTKPGWLSDLEHALDNAVPRLVAALDHIAAELPAAVARLDRVTSTRLTALDATLRDAVDGLDHVLASDRQRLDAALAARVEQLANIAGSLEADVHAIALGVSTRISASVDELLVATRASALRLLGSLDVQVGRVETAGTEVVGQLYSSGQDLAVRVIGVALVLVGLIGGALVFVSAARRRQPIAFGVQTASVLVVTAAGAVLILATPVRMRLLHVQDVVLDHRDCPQALADAAGYLARYHAGATPTAVADATTVLPAVASCLVMSGSSELFKRATARLAEIRTLLGIARACTSAAECPAGEDCDVASGGCVQRCGASRDCPAAMVCHASQHSCGPPCTGTCPGGAICKAGECSAAPASRGALDGPGGLGGGRWTRAATCHGDATCLMVLGGPAREALTRLAR